MRFAHYAFIFCLLIYFYSAFGETSEIETKIKYSDIQPSGILEFKENNGSASRSNIKSDLGISATASLIQIGFALKSSQLSEYFLSYSFAKYAGTKTIGEPLIFNETSFSTGEKVRTEIETHSFQIGYNHAVIKNADYCLALGGSIRYNPSEVALSSSLRGTDSDRINILYPAIGIEYNMNLRKDLLLKTGLEGSVFNAGYAAVNCNYISLSLEEHLSDNLYLEAGLSRSFFKVKEDHFEDDNFLLLKSDGIFISLGYSL